MTCGTYPCFLEVGHRGNCRPLDDRIIKVWLAGYHENPRGKWFTVTERQYEREPAFWFVTGPSVEGSAYDFVVNHLYGISRYKGDHGFVVFANSKRQVEAWIRNSGKTMRNQAGTYVQQPTQEDHMARTARDRKIEALERQAERAQEKIDRLLSLPDEPEVKGEKPLVIFFEKSFHNHSTIYTYAAVKAPNGLWYTTGPSAPKGYTWDELVDWIMEGSDATVIYRAKRFDAL